MMQVILRHSLHATVPIIGAICLGGCLGRPQPAPAPRQPAVALLDTVGLPGVAAEQFVTRDTSLREAVARYLIGYYAGYRRVRIDEQPLPTNLEAKAVKSDRSEAPVALQTFGLRLARLEHCSPALSSVDSTMQRGCPKEKYVLVAFGSPRQGPPEVQPKDPSKAIGLTPNSWSIRVVTSEIGPGGWAVLSGDYVFEKRYNGTWLFLGSNLVAWVE